MSKQVDFLSGKYQASPDEPGLMRYRPEAKAIGGAAMLTEKDLDELGEATRRVFALMSDGQWHTRHAIEYAAGQIEGTRRMRELRKFGYEIEKQRLGDNRQWVYRLAQLRRAA